MDRKQYVGTSNYWSLSELMGEGVVISLQTFYELYKKNPDIRQCIRKIANSVSRDWLSLTNNKGEVVDDTELLDEVMDYFRYPTFLKFKVDLYRNYLLSGELYITPIRNLRMEILGFEVLDTRAMAKVVNQNGSIVWYKQYSKTGTFKTYNIDDIAYFKFEDDINNANLGMWLLHWVVWDALSDLEATKTNHKLYENGAIPDSMLLLDDALSDSEMQLAKEQFNNQYRWTQNAHKMLIGWGIKDIKTLALTNRDMEFMNQRLFTVQKVAATFGVPKSILGYVDDVNLANGKELRKEYIEWTIRPYEKDFENILNTLSSKFLPEVYASYWIKPEGETLDDRVVIEENQRKDIEKGIITINEARIERWMNEVADENADKLIVGRNNVLLEDLALDAVLSPNEVSNGNTNQSQEDTK